MATLKELNLRLASLKNTKKITEAMKMIATTKMNRSVQRLRGSEKYQEYLNKVVQKITEGEESNHFLLQSKNVIKNIRVLLITSDRGLCGAFNSSLFKEFNQFLNQSKENGIDIKIDFCGNKGYNLYQKVGEIELGEKYEDVIKLPHYEHAIQIAEDILEDYHKGGIDEYYLVYNHYESALSQKPTVKKLIPFNFEEHTEEDSSESSFANVGMTIIEPSKEDLMEDLIYRYLFFEIFYCLLHSVVGENSARMRAMDSATKNCDDMIDSITLQRNRVRQASITRELIEIISGAESL